MKFKFRPNIYLAPNAETGVDMGGVTPETAANPENPTQTPPPADDTSGLKSALQKERDRAKQLEKESSQLTGV